jgi:uncharacterized membrane protein
MSPSLILFVRSLHILSAIVMLGGILARQIVRREAARSTDVRQFAALTAASRRLDDLMVIPGSTAVAALGLLLALITGAPLLGFLQGADRNWLLVAIALMLLGTAIVPLVFLPQRRRIEAALKIALQQDRMTPELRAAADDRAARFWHLTEEIVVVVIVLLMALRPF